MAGGAVPASSSFFLPYFFGIKVGHVLCWTRCCKNHQGWGARHHVLAFRRPSPCNPAGDGAEHCGSQPAHPVAPLQAGRRKKNRAANGSELLERPLSSQRCCWMPKYPRRCPVGFNTPKITAAPWIPRSTIAPREQKCQCGAGCLMQSEPFIYRGGLKPLRAY